MKSNISSRSEIVGLRFKKENKKQFRGHCKKLKRTMSEEGETIIMQKVNEK